MATAKENADILRSFKDKVPADKGSKNKNVVAALMEDLNTVANECGAPGTKAKVSELVAEGKDAIAVIVVNPSVYFQMGMISAEFADTPDEQARFVTDTLRALQSGGPQPGQLLWRDVPVITSEGLDHVGAAVIILEPEGRKMLDHYVARATNVKAERATKASGFRI